MHLNSITRNKKSNTINFQYLINNNKLYKKITIKDLGIAFSYNSIFTEHINIIYNKALRVFRFLRRHCWKFNDPSCLSVFLTRY